MKDNKNKTNTTAVQSMQYFNRARAVMESIADNYTNELKSVTESEVISDSDISTDGKANWMELTKVNTPAMQESYEPRFANVKQEVNEDDKLAIAKSMKKYLAEAEGEFINLNRLPGMAVVIANDTGLSPVAVEDYIDKLINESPSNRDSQQRSHDMTGRVDAGATTKDTVPEDGVFPSNAEEAITGETQAVEPALEPIAEPIEEPVIEPTEPSDLAPVEEPIEDAPVPEPMDEDLTSSLDDELSALDAELDSELAVEDEGELPEALPEVVPEDGEGDDMPVVDTPDMVDDSEEEEEKKEDDLDEELDDSFMESIANKRNELNEIKARFESISHKYLSDDSVSETNADESSAIVESEDVETELDTSLQAKLEAISSRINQIALVESEEDDEVIPADVDTDVSAKLESIRSNLEADMKRKTMLESIRDSLLESVKQKSESKDVSGVSGEESAITESARSGEIKRGIEDIVSMLESIDIPSKDDNKDRLLALKAKFESIVNKEFGELDS